MKKILFLAISLLTAICVKAQKITVVDSDGNGIHLVTVLAEDAGMIGTTDLSGTILDVKGARKVVLTHVAYKPKVVDVQSLQNGKVTMEDLDYNLAEVVVRPKSHVYVETYYRAYAFADDSLRYYMAGIMPNAYDVSKKKVKLGSYSNSKGEFYMNYGMSITWGARVQEFHAGRIYQSGAKRLKPGGDAAERYFTTLTDEGGGRTRISNPEGTVGFIETDKKQTSMTLDAARMQMYRNKALGQNRLLKLREEKDYNYRYVEVFDHDEDGSSDATDLVMYSNHWEWNGGKGRMKLIIETYATQRSYMDKAEFKERKDELKKKYATPMSLDQLEGYATSHGIPALAPSLRKAIEKLPKKM